MYKALIIDDEAPVRQAIKILGKWGELNINTLFEAEEGYSALKILREEKPDIVLVDMKMPVMNGVEFLNVAREEFPNVKYIVISGYDDFEYAKQAIKFKVLDYLLKPIIEKELDGVLSRAVSELDLGKEKAQKELHRNIEQNISVPLLKEIILSDIIEGIGKTSLMEDYKRILQIDRSDGALYEIVILRIINFNEVCCKKFDSDAHSLYFAIVNVVEELCKPWSRGFSVRNSKAKYEIIIVLSVQEVEPEELKKLTVSGAKSIIEELEKLFSVYSLAGIGGLCTEFETLSKSYNQAEDILNSINLLDSRNNVFDKKEGLGKSNRISIMDKKELLINAFENGSMEYTRKILNEYFERIMQSGYFSMDDARKAAVELAWMIEDIIAQLGIYDEDIKSYFKHDSIEGHITSFEDLSGYVFNILEKVLEVVRKRLKLSEKANLYKIKEYIDKNFFKEIKLNMFSDKYYLSKEYLSKLFKEEFGYSIYEYALKVRMQKAKEILEDSNIKVQTISQQLGYSDCNYFSKAFKKYYGFSPSDFRNHMEEV